MLVGWGPIILFFTAWVGEKRWLSKWDSRSRCCTETKTPPLCWPFILFGLTTHLQVNLSQNKFSRCSSSTTLLLWWMELEWWPHLCHNFSKTPGDAAFEAQARLKRRIMTTFKCMFRQLHQFPTWRLRGFCSCSWGASSGTWCGVSCSSISICHLLDPYLFSFLAVFSSSIEVIYCLKASIIYKKVKQDVEKNIP